MLRTFHWERALIVVAACWHSGSRARVRRTMWLPRFLVLISKGTRLMAALRQSRAFPWMAEAWARRLQIRLYISFSKGFRRTLTILWFLPWLTMLSLLQVKQARSLIILPCSL